MAIAWPGGLPRGPALTAGLVGATGVLLGMLTARDPRLGIVFTALADATVLAFLAPVTHLTLLLALTAIVPYTIQNRYSPGGSGTDSPGLLASDLLVLTGIWRAAVVLPGLRLDRRRLTVVALVLVFVVLTCFEAAVGLRAGRPLADVGAELRTLAGGMATALIALVVLAERGAPRRVLRGLLLIGLALGAWGVAQWAFQLSFNGEFGVRGGVSLTSEGRGQVQGGLFSFPVAVILATAALVSGQVRGTLARTLVLLALCLNAASLLLTFERTFWVATVFGVLLVVLRTARARRLPALVWIASAIAAALLVLAAAAPGTFQTARERLVSIGSYQTDPSIRYRDVESRFVLDKIHARPVLGWGLADTIYWGQPWLQSPPTEEAYTHVGYLWLTWREGFVGTAVLLALLALAVFWRGRAAAGGLPSAVRVGCQASIAALLLVNVTFPAFQGVQIMYVIGFLVAFAALPVGVRRRPAD
jgi:hypothetical protein